MSRFLSTAWVLGAFLGLSAEALASEPPLPPDRPELTLRLGVGGNTLFPSSSASIQEARVQDLIEVGLGARSNAFVGLELNGFFSLFPSFTSPESTGALWGLTGDAILYVLPEAKHFEPYVLVGVGVYGLKEGGGVAPMEGLGAQGGVGLRVRANPVLSFGVRALYRGAFVEATSHGGESGSVSRAFLSMVSFQGHVILQLGN